MTLYFSRNLQKDFVQNRWANVLQYHFLAKSVAIYFFSGKIENFWNLTSVTCLTNSMCEGHISQVSITGPGVRSTMNFLPVSDVMLQRKWETQWGRWSSFGLLDATKSFQARARAAGATARAKTETFQTRARARAAEVFQTKISRNTSELEGSGQHTRQDTNSLKLSNPKLFKIFQDYFSIYKCRN